MIRKMCFSILVLVGAGYCDFFPLKTGNSWYYAVVDSFLSQSSYLTGYGNSRITIDSSKITKSKSEYFFTDSLVKTARLTDSGKWDMNLSKNISHFTVTVSGNTISGHSDYLFLLSSPYPIKLDTSYPWPDNDSCDFSLNNQRVNCFIRKRYPYTFTMADNVGIIWSKFLFECTSTCMGRRGLQISYSLISYRLNGVEKTPIFPTNKKNGLQSQIRALANGVYFGPQDKDQKIRVYSVKGKLIDAYVLNKGDELLFINWKRYSEKTLIFSVGNLNSLVINPSY